MKHALAVGIYIDASHQVMEVSFYFQSVECSYHERCSVWSNAFSESIVLRYCLQRFLYFSKCDFLQFFKITDHCCIEALSSNPISGASGRPFLWPDFVQYVSHAFLV